MPRRIRADLEGVVYEGGLVLKAGDVVPEGVVVGDHAAEDFDLEATGDPGPAGGDGDSGEVDATDDGKSPTKAELQTEIELRNKDRADEDQIKPAGRNKADLIAALEADTLKS